MSGKSRALQSAQSYQREALSGGEAIGVILAYITLHLNGLTILFITVVLTSLYTLCGSFDTSARKYLRDIYGRARENSGGVMGVG